jgi:signal transduction histidine kinase
VTALRTDLFAPQAGESSDALLRAVLAISGELDLHSVLIRVVEAAVELTDARYGALGVIGGDGQLCEFLTTGLDADEAAAIGPLPRGEGLLGLLLKDPRPIRLENLSAHPASVGMPSNHPPMSSFLGVPIRIRGTVFGNLYLTDKTTGSFTDNDEQLVLALAQAAALVIDNARTYGVSERRRQWLEASAELADALQPPIALDEALQAIVARAGATAAARRCAIVQLPEGGHPVISASDGDSTDDLPALVRRVLGDVRIADTQAVAIDVDLGEYVARVIPLRAHLADPGALIAVLGRDAAGEQGEREMLAAFVDQAGLALDRTQAFADREELAVVKERARIARDLHDVVIQRLFAAGLKMQVLRNADSLGDDRIDEVVDDLVGDLDTTIKNIRTTIFGLQQRTRDSLRGEVLDLVEEYAAVLGFKPTLRTHGPIDLMVPDEVREHLLAVLREALSIVARHSGGRSASVDVRVTPSELTLEVSDAGVGIPEQRHESGLRNARERAACLGGSFEVTPNVGQGTTLRWSCPLDESVSVD